MNVLYEYNGRMCIGTNLSDSWMRECE